MSLVYLQASRTNQREVFDLFFDWIKYKHVSVFSFPDPSSLKVEKYHINVKNTQ